MQYCNMWYHALLLVAFSRVPHKKTKMWSQEARGKQMRHILVTPPVTRTLRET